MDEMREKDIQDRTEDEEDFVKHKVLNIDDYVASLISADKSKRMHSNLMDHKIQKSGSMTEREYHPQVDTYAESLYTPDVKKKKKRFWQRANKAIERVRSAQTEDDRRYGITKQMSLPTDGISERLEATYSFTLTDFESDMENNLACFSEIENDNVPKYLCKQKKKYVKLDFAKFIDISKKEWKSYTKWLTEVIRTPFYENESFGSPPSIRFLIFLHFLRLEIPVEEIKSCNIASESDWRKKKRLIFHNVASFIMVPLDSNYSPDWWCKGGVPPADYFGYSFVIHTCQTFTEEKKMSKIKEKFEKKQQLEDAIMKQEPIPIFYSADPKTLKEKEIYAKWILKWIISRSTPNPLRLNACRSLVSIACPNEMMPGLIKKIWRSGASSVILNYARKGEIRIHRHIPLNSLSMDSCLDKGAVGKVFLSKLNDNLAAVKICSKHNVAFNLEEFNFEVALMCLFQHPSILPCIGADLESNPDYILISPLKEKGNLRKVLDNKEVEISWSQKIKFAIDVVKGLEALHKNKVVHRDIKSPNILISNDNRAFITDFGNSKFIHEIKKESLVGTTEWMAPEMFAEGRDYDYKVDVYSFGILLYEIVTRKMPYIELKSFEVADHVLAGGRPKLLPSDCPYDFLIKLIEACWHQSPRKRPSLLQIKQKLKEFLKRIQSIDNINNNNNNNNIIDNGETPSPRNGIKKSSSITQILNLKITRSRSTDNDENLDCSDLNCLSSLNPDDILKPSPIHFNYRDEKYF